MNVYVKDINSTLQKCRSLIDSSSQSTFVKESFVNLLLLKRNKIIRVDGLSTQKINNISGSIQSQIFS